MTFDPVRQADWWHPQWVRRRPTPEESQWITDWMATPGEVTQQWKVIDDMLRAAGYVSNPGGGPENDDLVRDLIHRAARADKIVGMHQKHVGPGGLTSGDCTECGYAWPCPTYEWAKPDSTRDWVVDCWDPADDE